ncbi:hypothetical protein [Sulfolobus acidocaldarius]|uniref:Conserved conjugative plasmid protein n=4 Tax=Sulfolobus acidocaldarius TaxID=2285 RepID=Q4JBB4_SULAC|nr:hypothetical protein [Sulfolobus acidocaldarius]AAY79915.1 conserved conjugative plasmid protein [Sulfolobus acidocaldarius DSM 639]AGE70480.1 conjugative plasmid protein [Sulfolobus acidocaldarius N8]AGE72753.1 conjugative plasmid protein [Sulfolobus acidocaldarius Ron12/I]ALU29145.1 conjugal transfer protein [Sulfolobus acidocaldarius]ALU31871.1 conjugal transfer protein [Sulfolobus acidocaldarius]
MYVIKVKDPKEIVELARKYKGYPMELLIYLNDPQSAGGLKSRRKVELIKSD